MKIADALAEIVKLLMDQKQKSVNNFSQDATTKAGVPNKVIQLHDNRQNPIHFITSSDMNMYKNEKLWRIYTRIAIYLCSSYRTHVPHLY